MLELRPGGSRVGETGGQWPLPSSPSAESGTLVILREVYTGKGACPHIGRSLRIATRSNPLVARSTALLFSRRCLRCSPSYRDLKFAPFRW